MIVESFCSTRLTPKIPILYQTVFQELEEERQLLKDSSEKAKREQEKLLAPVEGEEGNEEEDMMQQMMGFSNFDTTANKQVIGNIHGDTRCQKQRKYRQYMNRKGGFNRPLDSM